MSIKQLQPVAPSTLRKARDNTRLLPIVDLIVELHPARWCAGASNAPPGWPLQAAKHRAECTMCTLGDCIAATPQACMRQAARHVTTCRPMASRFSARSPQDRKSSSLGTSYPSASAIAHHPTTLLEVVSLLVPDDTIQPKQIAIPCPEEEEEDFIRYHDRLSRAR